MLITCCDLSKVKELNESLGWEFDMKDLRLHKKSLVWRFEEI